MGQDINLVFEVSDGDGWRNVKPEVMCVHENIVWEREGNYCYCCRDTGGIYPSDSLPRNYKLFSLMKKGFRALYPRKGINPRGEPPMISKKSSAVFWHWGEDCESWVTLTELQEFALLSAEEPTLQLQALLTELAFYAEGPAENVRILFNFS